MNTPEFRLPYCTYDRVTLLCSDPSRTKQSFADECDFNSVMAKWATSGLITNVNMSQPIYADVSHISDYQSSLELIRSAQDQFNSLPSKIRDRFGNNPGNLLAFLSDPSNREEAVRLGLIEPTLDVDKSAATQKATDDLSTSATEGS